MNAKAEQRSLSECPLPEETIKDPLTMVWQLDGDILKLEKQIEAIRDEREKYLSYAIKNGIDEDSQCKMEIVTVTPKQTVDLSLLRTKYKKAWDRIWQSKKQEARDAVDLFGTNPEECKAEFSVTQPEVKKALKADNVIIDVVLHRVGQTRIDYKVVKK